MNKENLAKNYFKYFGLSYIMLLVCYSLCLSFIWLFDVDKSFFAYFFSSHWDFILIFLAYVLIFLFVKRLKHPQKFLGNVIYSVLGIIAIAYLVYTIYNYVIIYMYDGLLLIFYGIGTLIMFLLPFMYFINYFKIQKLNNTKEELSLKTLKVNTLILIIPFIIAIVGWIVLLLNNTLSSNLIIFYQILFVILLIAFILINFIFQINIKNKIKN